MSIEKNFDVSFIADLALREKQIQQNYRPIIAVHKWFARRPGTLFRGLILSEFVEKSLRECFFSSNKLTGVRIADPFMGGGTPLLEANRVGCDVIGYDVNPMAYWIVRQEIAHLDLEAYRKAGEQLMSWLEGQIGHLYRTRCLHCDSVSAHIKYFLWVKTQTCSVCQKDVDLFPGHLIAEDKRHPKNVFVCPACGNLREAEDRERPGDCRDCGFSFRSSVRATRGRGVCPHCQTPNTYPSPTSGPPRHRMFALEYHCLNCKKDHNGRFFKKPDESDLSKYLEAVSHWEKIKPQFVPDDEIPPGDESDRLHKWGYRHYQELFNPRQLLGLELSCGFIQRELDDSIRNALATNLSDLLRYQNMLCRYDTMALKSLDIFSVHGFPIGLVQCESNFLGIPSGAANVGSGGWSNILQKYLKAKSYCKQPFEVRSVGHRKILLPISGEWIGEGTSTSTEKRKVVLHCQSATYASLPPASLDAVFTDPPYFGNVQYAELMDFCYVWLRRLVGGDQPVFRQPSTRNKNELTGNAVMERGFVHFAEGLSDVFQKMAQALKPGAPLAFTYHHNRFEAYYPIAVAILDAELTCSASLPCPAEMGGSIHINGTGSSVVDTVFVCRSTGSVPRRLLCETPSGVADLVRDDLTQLRVGGLKPTRGDIHCIVYGHLIRLAIWRLRVLWEKERPTPDRLKAVETSIVHFGGVKAVEDCLAETLSSAPRLQNFLVQEDQATYGDPVVEIPF